MRHSRTLSHHGVLFLDEFTEFAATRSRGCASRSCYLAVMVKKRGPAEFPGRLTGEVILHIDHYDLNEKAERHRRQMEAVSGRPRWRRWVRRRIAGKTASRD